jgi:hypothetical protein
MYDSVVSVVWYISGNFDVGSTMTASLDSMGEVDDCFFVDGRPELPDVNPEFITRTTCCTTTVVAGVELENEVVICFTITTSVETM